MAGVARGVILLALGACLSKPPPPPAVSDASTPPDAAHGSAAVFVQTSADSSGATSGLAVAFGQDVTAGDLLVVAYDWDMSSPLQDTLTDSQGNPYRDASAQVTSCCVEKLAYALAGQSGADRVTLDLGAAAANYIEVRLLDYAGPVGFDRGSATGGSASAAGPVEGPALATSGEDELVVAFTLGAGTVVSVGSAMTLRSSFDEDVVADALVPTAGAYTATAELGGPGTWSMCVGEFR